MKRNNNGHNNIIMSTLYYDEEIRLDETENIEKFSKKELELATKLIDNMTDAFKPKTYHDDYQNKIKEAIKNKLEGKEIIEIKNKRPDTIEDLMEALEKSIKKSKDQ